VQPTRDATRTAEATAGTLAGSAEADPPPAGRLSQQDLWYEIRLRGSLGGEWSAWFDGFAIRVESDGNTVLYGPLRDDAALYGLISKARDLGRGLVGVSQTSTGPA
jgi:hypothetical protein